ncbi:MAG: CBS domain-containing protein [Desulfomicrobium escambiense]|nr:CBS domain-containing protein [Desulfomicrobium escambiense]
MIPAKIFIGPEESVAKAAYLMIHNDLVILPVLERKMQLVGVVRLTRIFEAIAEPLLAD